MGFVEKLDAICGALFTMLGVVVFLLGVYALCLLVWPDPAKTMGKIKKEGRL